MSKNHRSWESKRDPIKDLKKLKEDTLKHALMPRELPPLLISSKMYELLQANCPDFLKYCKVISYPASEPDPTQQ